MSIPENNVRFPLAGDVPIASLIDQLVQEGVLAERLSGDRVHCFACAHHCKITPAGRGICQVRYNLNGNLMVPFGYVAALQCDPTEKKPFYHVYPGSETLTFGMLGCDMHCQFCQNWDISQALRDTNSGRPVQQVSAEQVAHLAVKNGARCVASSYNEPLITSEWAHAIFGRAKAEGLSTLYVSNGNATRQVMEYLRPVLDGYKIDLKTMRERQYRKLGAVLENILESIRMAHQLGFWVEVVTLIVPGMNDSVDELRETAQFICSVSPDIPWHVTAFYPQYRMLTQSSTALSSLIRAAEIGYQEGLHFVYAGNAPGRVGRYENTFCPQCGELLIGRLGYVITEYHLTAAGTCPHCQQTIAGLWSQHPENIRTGRFSDLF